MGVAAFPAGAPNPNAAGPPAAGALPPNDGAVIGAAAAPVGLVEPGISIVSPGLKAPPKGDEPNAPADAKDEPPKKGDAPVFEASGPNEKFGVSDDAEVGVAAGPNLDVVVAPVELPPKAFDPDPNVILPPNAGPAVVFPASLLDAVPKPENVGPAGLNPNACLGASPGCDCVVDGLAAPNPPNPPNPVAGLFEPPGCIALDPVVPPDPGKADFPASPLLPKFAKSFFATLLLSAFAASAPNPVNPLLLAEESPEPNAGVPVAGAVAALPNEKADLGASVGAAALVLNEKPGFEAASLLVVFAAGVAAEPVFEDPPKLNATLPEGFAAAVLPKPAKPDVDVPEAGC